MTFLRWVLIVVAILLVVRIVRQVLQAVGPSLRGRAANPEFGPRGRGGSAAGEAARTPYEVLGVEASASEEQVRVAYQRLVQQYHPDRVAHLAPELQELAERRTKQINEAYQALQRGGRRGER